MPPRTKVTIRLQSLGFLTSQEDFCHTYSRIIILSNLHKHSSWRQQWLQESRDQRQLFVSKREWSCWLLLFWRFSDKRALQQSQVQYKIHSTGLYPCPLVFRDNVSRVILCSWATVSPWPDSLFSQTSWTSSLNRTERLGSWFISFSVVWRPRAEMTTAVRACTQTTKTHTQVTVFLWVPKLPRRSKWWIGSPSWSLSYLIPCLLLWMKSRRR